MEYLDLVDFELEDLELEELELKELELKERWRSWRRGGSEVGVRWELEALL